MPVREYDHGTHLVFEYPSPERARIVEHSVGREAGDIEGDRTAASVTREDSCVVVCIEAADLVALRAGVNTWCSLVGTAERVADAA